MTSQLSEGPWEDLSEMCCAGWTWLLGGMGDVSRGPAAWVGVTHGAARGVQSGASLQTDGTWAQLHEGIRLQTAPGTSAAAPRNKVGVAWDAGLHRNTLWRRTAQETSQLSVQINLLPQNNFSNQVSKRPPQLLLDVSLNREICQVQHFKQILPFILIVFLLLSPCHFTYDFLGNKTSGLLIERIISTTLILVKTAEIQITALQKHHPWTTASWKAVT